MGYGDSLMVTGRARVMQQSDPRKCRLTYQGIGKFVRGDDLIFQNNPRIARPDEVGDFQELQARGAGNIRPYHTAKTPERWSYNLSFRPDVGEIYFTEAELAFGSRYTGLIIIEPNLGPGASPNKQWPLPHWQRFVRLATQAGIELTQLGPHGNRILPGVNYVLTESFRMAAAVLAGALAVVLHEGGLHHCAAALGVPGVVLFGGFTPVELTGYDCHRNLGVSLESACGMRTPCKHCASAMAAITPEQVFNELEGVLGDRQRTDRCVAEISS